MSQSDEERLREIIKFVAEKRKEMEMLEREEVETLEDTKRLTIQCTEVLREESASKLKLIEMQEKLQMCKDYVEKLVQIRINLERGNDAIVRENEEMVKFMEDDVIPSNPVCKRKAKKHKLVPETQVATPIEREEKELQNAKKELMLLEKQREMLLERKRRRECQYQAVMQWNEELDVAFEYLTKRNKELKDKLAEVDQSLATLKQDRKS